MRYQVEAPAKINPFLEILGPRPDGYHEVCFIMQTLALSDTLTLTSHGEGRAITFICSDKTLETPDNLVVKAYHLFYDTQPERISHAVAVTLEKRIPVQAGLGGGSSDAAAMLRLLNTLHQEAVSIDTLAALGGQLGSDVPFFLYGGTCQATGRGEKITPLPPAYAHQPVMLVKPLDFGIATPQAYAFVDATSYQPHPKPLDTLFNRFEPVLFPHYPLLRSIKQALMQHFGPRCLLSGSGPTFFLFLDTPPSPAAWDAFTALFPGQAWWTTQTMCLSVNAQQVIV